MVLRFTGIHTLHRVSRSKYTNTDQILNLSKSFIFLGCVYTKLGIAEHGTARIENYSLLTKPKLHIEMEKKKYLLNVCFQAWLWLLLPVTKWQAMEELSQAISKA